MPNSHFNHNVEKINTADGKAKSLRINGSDYEFDAVIASSDYHHTERLLDKKERNYTEKYWENRTFAPSCLIYYLGFKEEIPNLNTIHFSLKMI